MFKVIVEHNVSLSELARKDSEGEPVVRTPHVGNLYPANLAALKAGLRAVIYDQTLGSKDHNYHPHRVIMGGKSEMIGNPNIFLTHARVERASTLQPDRFPVGAKLAECHMQALREALPGNRAILFRDWLHENADVTASILMSAAKVSIDAWERFVETDGTVSARGLSGPDQLEREGILGVHSDDRGWVIPNAVAVLVATIVDVMKYKRNRVWHLSGPDMFRYFVDHTEYVNQMYSVVRHSHHNLPDDIELIIVPTADMTFVTSAERAPQLDALVNSVLDYMVGEVERTAHREVLTLRKGRINRFERATMENNEVAEKKRIQAAIKEMKDPLYRIEDGKYLSQYDVLNGHRLYVHQWGLDTPLKYVSEALRIIRWMRAKVR